jgi:cardiolipin synthase (CMP-forming)
VPAQRGRSLTRVLGFDRSGPPPAETLAGQPLRPWTIPNAIGFIRLALIPAFLVVALSSRGGVDPLSASLFFAVGWGDYLDGLLARITRQYSRLGTLMDPVSDRLLVISGVVVGWRFDLLPRWALAVLIARELVMLVLGRYAVGHGVEVRINWPGRLSVPPVMGSLFFAMTGLRTFPEALLYLGIAMALWASVLYFRYGLTQLRAPRP